MGFHVVADNEPILRLLNQLASEIEPLLERHQLSPDEAAEILREILVLLAYRWDRIDNRELWLLATLERNCLRQATRRRARPGSSPIPLS